LWNVFDDGTVSVATMTAFKRKLVEVAYKALQVNL